MTQMALHGNYSKIFVISALIALAVIFKYSGSHAAKAVKVQADIQGVFEDNTDTGKVHFVLNNGKEVTPANEDGAQGSESIELADDGKTVGWLATFPNCCTSYPIPRMLVIYSGGKVIQRIESPMMIWDWMFEKNSSQVALITGPVHGSLNGYYELRSVETGGVIATASDPLNDEAPAWAIEMHNKFNGD